MTTESKYSSRESEVHISYSDDGTKLLVILPKMDREHPNAKNITKISLFGLGVFERTGHETI